jgi:hypothetical protein
VSKLFFHVFQKYLIVFIYSLEYIWGWNCTRKQTLEINICKMSVLQFVSHIGFFGAITNTCPTQGVEGVHQKVYTCTLDFKKCTPGAWCRQIKRAQCWHVDSYLVDSLSTYLSCMWNTKIKRTCLIQMAKIAIIHICTCKVG